MNSAIDDQITSTLQVLATLLIFVFAYISYVLGRYQTLKVGWEDQASIADAVKPYRNCGRLLALALIPVVPVVALLTPRLVDVLTHWAWSDSVRTGFCLVYVFVFALMVAVAVLAFKIRVTIGRLRDQLSPHPSVPEDP